MSRRRYQRPPDVALVDGRQLPDRTDHIYLARLPDGEITVLTGSAAVIWREATTGDGDDLVSRVALRSAQNPADIGDDVRTFVADLVARGLLERGDPE